VVKHREVILFHRLDSGENNPVPTMLNPKLERASLREHMLLLREFVRYPFHTAALAPSSRHLARRMAASVPLSDARNVVELGPGTGALTNALLPRLSNDAHFLAVELNPTFAAEWSKQYPGRKVEVGSVANLREICARHEMESIDCIVSGLPWPSFPVELQEAALEEVLSLLKPGGQMVTFGYHVSMCMPSGRHFQRLINKRFRRAERIAWEWRNLPPAYILRCTK
jgi:phosphatidylethanolamine/phosphatidyl-N-methylethanolamine N-methyltransferase